MGGMSLDEGGHDTTGRAFGFAENYVGGGPRALPLGIMYKIQLQSPR
jgi:hypothetical protein